MDSIYHREITSKNVEIDIIYILSGCLIFLSSAINFFGITPLYNNSKLLYKKTLRMFKYLLKGSLNDIISRFEISIESITETYDISVDNKKNKYNNIESENVISRNIKKLKGYLINILLVASVLAFTIPIIVKDSEIITNLDYNLVAGERKKSILLSSILSYEVLLQDEITYVPGTAETLLYNEMKKLSDIQNQLYYGKLGLKPTRDIRNLDSILIYEDCRRDREECDTFEEVPEYGI
ncbi:hypothetical protein BCR32DRAFT_251419 [Anaeromyces robustus]|uniref:Uncharacterized protein n=1 Tax=Anaeromyces robustus TaxID=1754192 RepID=A0A1Y1VS15_9FUNG|nr:hypothetical protein BCR32DRAFT_251419 [Anaeromyces robustus]|eukprot:ORX63806.1 hypothetical protein BCR32DRAFT_251419 [Anaeromyces robustus]